MLATGLLLSCLGMGLEFMMFPRILSWVAVRFCQMLSPHLKRWSCCFYLWVGLYNRLCRWISVYLNCQVTPHKTRDSETYRGESGESLKVMGTVEKFLNRTAMDWGLRLRINKWDLIKLQSFSKAKDTVNKTKRPPTDWERIFTYPKSDRGLMSNIYKELKKGDSRKSNNPFKNGAQS